ncbi:hypothetical protein WR25_02840 [Diploscapter pachys]|uniref:Uncharacterized protein n=1 Tax=Diploscapter pachys TaxID=2018661 RepID=A0A2A2KQD3_9BILA|nr:hypothetical protein WR25_02840 [Diploscapter pachys]
MMLSPLLRFRVGTLLVRRWASSATGAMNNQAIPYAKIQLKKPEGEEGYFDYSRNPSRDPKWKGPVPQEGNFPVTFLTRRLGHAYEIYPLFFLMSFVIVSICTICWWSFGKVEVWLDRSQKLPPLDWERIHDNYWKFHTLAYDPEGKTRRRCEIMEVLEDEMADAAKKRGTR